MSYILLVSLCFVEYAYNETVYLRRGNDDLISAFYRLSLKWLFPGSAVLRRLSPIHGSLAASELVDKSAN